MILKFVVMLLIFVAYNSQELKRKEKELIKKEEELKKREAV